jgi:hypothetical protein
MVDSLRIFAGHGHGEDAAGNPERPVLDRGEKFARRQHFAALNAVHVGDDALDLGDPVFGNKLLQFLGHDGFSFVPSPTIVLLSGAWQGGKRRHVQSRESPDWRAAGVRVGKCDDQQWAKCPHPTPISRLKIVDSGPALA